jgi:hypothetical protein
MKVTNIVSFISATRVSPAKYNIQALSVLWPGLMPNPSTDRFIGVREWFSLTVSHATVQTALLFGSFSHRKALLLNRRRETYNSDDRRLIALCEICETESITNINRAIQDPVLATSDAVILSILCMATNKSTKSMPQYAMASPFQAPLRSLQWLDVYGRLLPNPVHQAGMNQIISLKGGLDKIKLPGLAAMIS